MPTIHDCERCEKECPKSQLARKQAEARMYATQEFVNLQKKIDAGELVEVVYAEWIYEKGNLYCSCSRCGGEELYEVKTYGGGMYHDINSVHSPYCPHCGAKMKER